MSFFSLVAALLLEQWRPLADRRYLFSPVARYATFLERQFNAGEAQQGATAWLLAVLPPVLGAWLVNAAALYLTMGFRQRSHYFTDIHLALKENDVARAREILSEWRGVSCANLDRETVTRLAIEEALVASHRHVFAVVFWFLVLPGPAGAILYRLAMFLERRWSASAVPELERFGHFARRAFAVLDWLPVRFTAAAFAVVGDFEDAVYCWRTQAATWPDPALGIVLASGAGAIGVKLGMPIVEGGEVLDRPELGLGDPADTAHLDSTVGLVWRALVMWLVLLALVALAGAAT
ncbi:MAG: CobD/CbiB family protein [Betaproteobacteria bacterium]|nr:MAG: CobD/CbiB family protein [Betaproteobacteria bacterium]